MGSAHAQLQRLIADLGRLPPDLRRELRPAIRTGARPMLSAMRTGAAWSSRIPPATTITTSFAGRGAGVSIVVNARRAPHARVYENSGNPGTFRAPLFGARRHWYPHQARPFFAPAIRAHGTEVLQAVGEAVATVAGRHGF